MIGKPKRRTTVGCCLPYIIKRSALSVFAQICMGMKITEHKKSIAVSTSNVKLPPGKRIRDSLYIPRRIIGCPIFPFEIYGISTALLHKNKCSTYKKYVSALFLFAPCIYTVYFKRLTERLFSKTLVLQNRHGWRWLYAVTMFFVLQKTRSPRMDTDVHSWAGLRGYCQSI